MREKKGMFMKGRNTVKPRIEYDAIPGYGTKLDWPCPRTSSHLEPDFSAGSGSLSRWGLMRDGQTLASFHFRRLNLCLPFVNCHEAIRLL